jgi:hypothetical protein
MRFLAATAFLVLALAACGGSASSSATSPASDTAAANADFVTCQQFSLGEAAPEVDSIADGVGPQSTGSPADGTLSTLTDNWANDAVTAPPATVTADHAAIAAWCSSHGYQS